MDRKVISPFHLFEYQGSNYVINVEGMQASTISETTAESLKMVLTEPQKSLSFSLEETVKGDLEKLGLYSVGKKEKNNLESKDPAPITYMYLFLTQSCNLRCIYCYGDGGGYGSGGSMEEKTAFQAIDWLIEKSGKMKKIHVGFFGGEPFLKFPLMKAVIEYARKRTEEKGKEIAFFAASNATLFNDEIIAFIKDQNISVMVSFDGSKEFQDAQRPYANGQGSYDSTVPKIKKLLTSLPGTSGHSVLVGNNDPQVVKDSMKEIGFTNLTISPASSSLFAETTTNRKPVRNAQTLIEALKEEADTWLRLIRCRDSEALLNLKSSSSLYGLYRAMVSLLHNSKRPFFCGAGRSLLGVSVSGDVYLCHRFVGQEEYKLGNIFEDHLYRDEYLKSPTNYNKTCADCFAKFYCGGGCKHDNLSACGSTAQPSEDMCLLRRHELELAAALISNLSPEDQAFLIEQQIVAPKPCPLDF